MFKRIILLNLVLMSSVFMLNACGPGPSQQTSTPSNVQNANITPEEQKKYDMANAELKPLGLKLGPPVQLPPQFANMAKSNDPVSSAFIDAMATQPRLQWIDKPVDTPIPDDLVQKAQPIAKKYFAGCTWPSTPKT